MGKPSRSTTTDRQRLTDDFAKATGLAARPGPRLLAGLADLGPEDDLLLQEFCRLERKPNLAEMEMLADACRAPMQIVCTWCKCASHPLEMNSS